MNMLGGVEILQIKYIDIDNWICCSVFSAILTVIINNTTNFWVRKIYFQSIAYHKFKIYNKIFLVVNFSYIPNYGTVSWHRKFIDVFHDCIIENFK